MESVKVSRTELLSVLKANRENHRVIFLEAQAGYRKMAIEVLDSMLADAKAGKKIRKVVQLVDPVYQTKDYDRAIRMLEMSQVDLIGLSESDFACYVMDEWSWKKQFSTSNRAYSMSLQALPEDPS
jgi:hypothetical protein